MTIRTPSPQDTTCSCFSKEVKIKALLIIIIPIILICSFSVQEESKIAGGLEFKVKCKSVRLMFYLGREISL